MFKKCLYKYEVAEILGISPGTLRIYLNKRYIDDLRKIGYNPMQKQLTPKQLNFLQNKIDLQPE